MFSNCIVSLWLQVQNEVPHFLASAGQNLLTLLGNENLHLILHILDQFLPNY